MKVADPINASLVPKPRRRLWVKVTAWVSFGVFLIAAACFLEFAIYFRRAEPILKKRVINTLATRFDGRVELDTFRASVWRGFEVTGGGLKIYPNQFESPQPLFSADTFSFRATWRDLLRTPMHIGTVHVTGLDIYIPPKSERERSTIPNFRIGPSKPGKIDILIDHFNIDRATLTIGTDKPGKVPLVFRISDLRMRSIGAGRPLLFHAILVNPKPIGNIDSTGSFGPFNAHSPDDTPVSGTYRFTHADLYPLKGIGGTLSSTGKYNGVLNKIAVDGETDTPNFSLDTAVHPMPLHTTFHAVVDGVNGDTHLDPVDAQLAHSHIIARGDVVTVPGQGHNITLDVIMGPARIEDLLQLSIKTLPPAMTGALTLHTKMSLPPGKEPVTEKLRLRGSFEITNAHFTDPKVQAKIDELSLRGQGHADQAKQAADNNIHPDIASDLRDNFSLASEKITITGLRFIVPGADIALNGVYSLDGKQIDFHGTARLHAKVSQLVTGWKSLLLKPVDPFFSKNGAGTQVPVSITGSRSDLHFGLDFHHNEQNKNHHQIPDSNQIP
jgi:hypothetical protein